MSEISSLEIIIQSDADKATKSLEKMDRKLEKVQKTLQKLESGNINSLSMSVENLSNSFNKLQSANTNFTKLRNAINSLGRMKSGNIFNVSAGLDKFATSFSKLNSISMNPDGLEKIVPTIRKLGYKSAANASDNMDKLSVSMVSFSDSMQKVNIPESGNLSLLANNISKFGRVTVSNAVTNIPLLSNSLSQLSERMKTFDFNADLTGLTNLASVIQSLGRVKSQNAIENLPNLSKGLNKLSRNLSKTTFDFDTKKLEEFAKSINMLGRKNTGAAIDNIPKIGDALEKLIRRVEKLPAVSDNLIKFTGVLASLTANGSKVGSMIRSTNSALSKTKSHAHSAGSGYKGLASTIGMLYAKYWMLLRAVQAVGKGIEKPINYIETLNYFDTAMEQIGKDNLKNWKESGYKSAEEYVKSFSERAKQLTQKMTGFEIADDGSLNEKFVNGTRIKSLGLDPNEIMNYQATFAQMSNSANLVAESVMNISDAMTMLATDWSSLRNTELDVSMQKFASGLAGSIRPLREYGIDISQTTLKQLALNYGIDDSITKMSNAAKVQLRTLAILQQSQVAMGDLAKTMNTPANQLRVLKQNFSMLAQSIGSLFMPIVEKVLPYINGLTIAIRRLFNWLGSLMGIKLSDYTSSVGSTDIDLELDGIGDEIDKAQEKADKLKRTVFGFDKANILGQSNKNSTTKGKGDGGEGYAVLDDAIAKEVDAYKKKWDEALNNMNDKAGGIADKICKAFEKIYKYSEPTRMSIKKLWDNGLSKLEKFNVANIKSFYNNFLVPIGKWQLGTGLPRFFDITNKMLEKSDWGKLNGSLDRMYKNMSNLANIGFDTLLDIYDNFFAPLGTWTISDAIPQIADIFSDLAEGVDWERIQKGFKNVAKAMEPIVEGIGQGFIDYFKDISKILKIFLNDVAPGLLDFTSGFLKMFKKEDVASITKDVLELVTTIEMIKLGKGVLKKFELLKDTLSNISIGGTAIKDLGKIETKVTTLTKAAGYVIALTVLVKGVKFTHKVSKDIMDNFDFEEVRKGFNEYFQNIFNGDNLFSKGFGDGFAGLTAIFSGEYTAKEWFDGTIDWMNANIEKYKKKFKEIANKIGEAFSDGFICGFLDAITPDSLGKQVVDKMQGKQPGAAAKPKEKPAQFNPDNYNPSKMIDGRESVQSFKKGWTEGAKDLDLFMQKQNKKVVNSFGTPDLSTKGKKMVNTLKKGYADKRVSLNEWLKTQNGSVKKNFGTVDLTSTGKSMANSLIKGFKSVKFPQITFAMDDKEIKSMQAENRKKLTQNTGGIGFSFKPKLYATGGLPTTGEIYIARESGSEMIGRIGNHNAVANNDQIVAGIASGVFNATLQANKLSAGYGQQSRPAVVQMVVDGKVIGQATVDYINETTRTTGEMPLQII